jgi:hypothetical protein
VGLSICRSIIEAHQGRLWATANTPRGAVFAILMVTNRIVEDGCSIHTAANVSRRILLSGVFGGSQVRPALPPSAARVRRLETFIGNLPP